MESKGSVLLAMCDQRPEPLMLFTARGGGHWALAATEERRARALAQPSPPLVAGRSFLLGLGLGLGLGL